MNYEFHSNSMAQSGSRALGSLIAKFKPMKNVSFNSYTKLYETSIASILDYASEIWGKSRGTQCEQIQQRAIRFFLGVHKFCPLPSMSGDMGWSTCQNRRQLHMLRFWNRLLSLQSTRLTRRVFDWDYVCNYTGWCIDIQNILESVNMLHLYYEKLVCPIEEVTRKLMSVYESHWLELCTQKPKLRTYLKFKNNYSSEPYVKQFMPRQRRSLIAQLRSGILPLRIETGRYSNTMDTNTGRFRKLKVEERTCLLCKSNDIEDEFHFVCKCSVYDELRRKLYNDISAKDNTFSELTDDEKFIIIVSHELKPFGEYISAAWKVRTDMQYNSNV